MNDRCVIFYYSLSIRITYVSSQSGEARLVSPLLRNRKKVEDVGMFLSRPVLNSSETLYVHFSIAISQVVSLDAETQALTIHIWEQFVSSIQVV